MSRLVPILPSRKSFPNFIKLRQFLKIMLLLDVMKATKFFINLPNPTVGVNSTTRKTFDRTLLKSSMSAENACVVCKLGVLFIVYSPRKDVSSLFSRKRKGEVRQASFSTFDAEMILAQQGHLKNMCLKTTNTTNTNPNQYQSKPMPTRTNTNTNTNGNSTTDQYHYRPIPPIPIPQYRIGTVTSIAIPYSLSSYYEDHQKHQNHHQHIHSTLSSYRHQPQKHREHHRPIPCSLTQQYDDHQKHQRHQKYHQNIPCSSAGTTITIKSIKIIINILTLLSADTAMSIESIKGIINLFPVL